MNVSFLGNWSFGYAYSVYLNGDTLFLASGGGVLIFDVSNSYSPVKISEVHTNIRGNAVDVFYENGKLYIANGDAGIEIWDVTDITNPVKLSSPSHT